MIPLGLKETRELDWATPLKVGAGLGSWGAPRYSPITEQMRKQARRKKGLALGPPSVPRRWGIPTGWAWGTIPRWGGCGRAGPPAESTTVATGSPDSCFEGPVGWGLPGVLRGP